MEPVSEEEWFHVPSSMAEWEEMRLAVSGGGEVSARGRKRAWPPDVKFIRESLTGRWDIDVIVGGQKCPTSSILA